VDPWIWIVYALAVARFTGLVTLDTITEPIRDRIIVALDDTPGSGGAWLAKLVTCPWCASVWISAVAAPVVWNLGHSPWLLVPALGLAFSFVSGATSNLGR
jgi:hypothetical protein